MAKRKERTVTCGCGKTFTAFGNRAKYCPECAKKAAAAQIARSNAARREERASDDETYHFCDNQAQIQACLNCKQNFCTGERCSLNKSLGRKRAGRPPIEDGTRERVSALRAQGLLHREIAKKLGISQSTVGRWLAEENGRYSG